MCVIVPFLRWLTLPAAARAEHGCTLTANDGGGAPDTGFREGDSGKIKEISKKHSDVEEEANSERNGNGGFKLCSCLYSEETRLTWEVNLSVGALRCSGPLGSAFFEV